MNRAHGLVLHIGRIALKLPQFLHFRDNKQKRYRCVASGGGVWRRRLRTDSRHVM